MDSSFQLLIDATLSPAAQSKIIAAYAKEQAKQATDTNRRILGRVVDYSTVVDGLRGAHEEDVRANGTIVYQFAMIEPVLRFISKKLHDLSPVLSGLYQRSHTLFVDGAEIDVNGEIPADGAEYVFMNPLPYAIRIEQGESMQAEAGVYEVTAMDAAAEFGELANIQFDYRSPINADRYISVGISKNLRHRRNINRHNNSRVPSILIQSKIRTLH